MSIAAATRVVIGGNGASGGRQGVAVYDNTAVTDDTHPSVIVIFADSTYIQAPRASLTTTTGGFFPGTGPGV